MVPYRLGPQDLPLPGCLSLIFQVKYLERKMAEEEESKRRKEDMVSTFMKLKMRKEERFEALNVSKLMEHWRSLMRIAKSRDLQGDIRVLMDSFNRFVCQSHTTSPNLAGMPGRMGISTFLLTGRSVRSPCTSNC